MNRPLEPSECEALVWSSNCDRISQSHVRFPRVRNKSVVETVQGESCETCCRYKDDLGRHGDFIGGHEQGKRYIPNMSMIVDRSAVCYASVM
jgi:hypothetical protein